MIKQTRWSYLLILLAFATLCHAEIFPGEMFVKFQGEPQQWLSLSQLQTNDAQLKQLLSTWKVVSAEQNFPEAFPPEKVGGVELRTWWKLHLPESTDINAAVAAFKSASVVLAAQPSFVFKTFFTYNDRNFSRQYGMSRVHSSGAHDIYTGNDSIIIAIVDTGIDYNHPDLSANMWHDAQGNHGRNFCTDQAATNPMPTAGGSHGTHCAGIADACTNNSLGVASLAYRAKLMAVRCGQSTTISYGFEGIQWAANNGADVISCSWGSSQSDSREQAVMDYAWNLNCVIICAAGNDGNDSLHYPAALNHVVAVASSDQNDRRSSFSCYGNWVDVTAPGSNIYSTVPNSSYEYMDGTSMACPFAASLAGLIKGKMGHASRNIDVVTVLEESCDNIDATNPNYIGRLGHGRINAQSAMQMLNYPQMDLTDHLVTRTDGEGRVTPGDSGMIVVYLRSLPGYAPFDSFWVDISTTDPAIQMNEMSVPGQELTSGSNWNNEHHPIYFKATTTSVPHNVQFTVQVFGTPGDFSAEFYFNTFIGWQEALLVDDDGNTGYHTYYDTAMTNLGISHDVFNTVTQGSLPPEYLSNFRWVIWETGSATSTIDVYDQGEIEDYIRAGGQMLLSSQRLPSDPQTTDFMSNVLHCGVSFVYDSTMLPGPQRIIASGAGPFTSGNFYLVGSEGAGNGNVSPTVLDPEFPGEVIYTYSTTGEACGIARTIGSGRLVFFSVALESISRTSQTPALRALITNYRNSFLSSTGVAEEAKSLAIPTSFAVGNAFPNPFNSTTHISLALPVTQDIHLVVYDISGREVMSENYRNLTAGNHRLSVSLPMASSGVYFASVRTTAGTTITRKLVYLR